MHNILGEDGSRETLFTGSAAQVKWLDNIYKMITFLKTVFLQNIKQDNRANIFHFYFSFTVVRTDAL